MRIGNNPLRYKPAPYQFKDIVFLVVTHLPSDESEYHQNRLEVIQTCLQTMRDNSHREHTFMVWDNDSSHVFKLWLQTFDPDILIYSKNIGKNQARAAAIQMLPLGSIVCYSDDDILYYDNWLNPQIKLLNHFQAASVSGMPIRTMFRWGNEHTIAWANKHGKVERGKFIPDEWEDDYAISIGRNIQEHREMTKNDLDIRVSYNGSMAYCTGHHAQFIGYAAKILPALAPINDMAMSDEKPTDIAMDKIGLRLCTIERYCRHIGNVLDEKIKQETMEIG